MEPVATLASPRGAGRESKGAAADHNRAIGRRRGVTLLVMAGVLVAAAAVGLARSSPSFPAALRVRLDLAALTPLPPNETRDSPVSTTRPSCDDYPPCVAAAVTSIATAPVDTFAALERTVPSWAARNGLTSQATWHCGSGWGLFGAQSAFGCQLYLRQSGRGDAVYVAATFTDPPAGAGPIANPLPAFGQSQLATIAVQVVRDSH